MEARYKLRPSQRDESDGLYYWDDSRTQINAQLGPNVGAGYWTLYVRNPSSGTPSNGVAIHVL